MLIFTTPVARSHRAVLVEQVILYLQPLHVRNGGYAERIQPWNGEGAQALIDKLNGASPAILVSAGNGTRQEHRGLGRDNARKRLDLDVFVISTHFDSWVARSYGDHNQEQVNADTTRADPGAYQILQDIEELLHGAPAVGAGSDQFEFDRDVIEQQDDLTVWRAVYTIQVTCARAPASPADKLLEIRQRHRLASTPQVQVVDATADTAEV